MTPQRRLATLALLLSLTLTAAEPPQPELLAEWNGLKITRADAAPLLPADKRDTEPAGAPEVWKKAVCNLVYRRILQNFLTAKGVTPSFEGALFFLQELHRLMPPDPQNTEVRRKELARDPDLQLNAALLQYLSRNFPDRMQVTDAEAAAAYRAAPQQLIRQARVVYGFLQFEGDDAAAVKRASSARAQLLQGKPFELLAAEVNPNGVRELPPELAEELIKAFPKPQKLQVSPPLTVQSKVYLIQIREYEPSRLCTLEESLPYLRLKLAQKKASHFMQNLLQEELTRHPVVFLGPLR